MKTYNANYKFEKNKVEYELKVNGQVFEIANDEIELSHISDLKKGLANKIINAVISAVSDDGNGLFIKNKPVIIMETELMQSNANESYSVLIDGNLYPISVNMDIEVTYFPIEYLK